MFLYGYSIVMDLNGPVSWAAVKERKANAYLFKASIGHIDEGKKFKMGLERITNSDFFLISILFTKVFHHRELAEKCHVLSKQIQRIEFWEGTASLFNAF